MLLTHRLKFILDLLQPICEWELICFWFWSCKILGNIVEFKKIKKYDQKFVAVYIRWLKDLFMTIY